MFDITQFGFTEEQWAALPEDRRIHFSNRATYQRKKAEKQAYGREYHRRKKAEQKNAQG